MNLISVLLSIIFGAIAVFLVLSYLEAQAQEDALAVSERRERRGLFMKLFGGVIFLLAPFMALLPFEERREKLRRRLIAAGSPGRLSPDEFDAARIVAMILGGFAGYFFDSEMGLSPVCTAGLVMLALVYPDIWLTGIIQRRRRRIFRDLPDFLDALRLAVDAGLDLNSALKICVEKGKSGPLLEEFERVGRDVTLGRTRTEAFRAFADRISMAEINSFVLALLQADQLGASVGPILKIQSEVARTRRWQLAEVLVNKMPMKMLAPLVLLIFPASFIILFTPLLIQYMQSAE
jgi:tight adherence protein C